MIQWGPRTSTNHAAAGQSCMAGMDICPPCTATPKPPQLPTKQAVLPAVRRLGFVQLVVDCCKLDCVWCPGWERSTMSAGRRGDRALLTASKLTVKPSHGTRTACLLGAHKPCLWQVHCLHCTALGCSQDWVHWTLRASRHSLAASVS